MVHSDSLMVCPGRFVPDRAYTALSDLALTILCALAYTGWIMPELRKPTAYTELWSAQMELPITTTPQRVREVVARYAYESGISVVGHFIRTPAALTLLRIPESNAEYRVPDVDECELSLESLARFLRADRVEREIVPPDTLHCMMDIRRGGHRAMSWFSALSTFERPNIEGYSMHPADIIAARVEPNGYARQYESFAAAMTLPHTEQGIVAIHDMGLDGQQVGYAISYGPCQEFPEGRTELYETDYMM